MTKPKLDVIVITGMSGAGRSAAADVLEDLGYYVIDNLPPALIANVSEQAQRLALVVDTRAGEFVDDLAAALDALRARGARTRVLFLDASDDVLVRRFEATRRRHPLARCGPPGIRRAAACRASLSGSPCRRDRERCPIDWWRPPRGIRPG